MATVEKTVELIFAGIDQVTPTLGGIQGGLGNLDAFVQGVADPLARVGEGVLKTDAALAVMASTLAGVAVKAAGEFGNQFGEISTLTTATAGDLEKFRTDILDYARTSGQSLQDITQAVYAAMSAGIDYSKSLDFLKVAEQLSVASRTDLTSTTKLLAGVLNAYGAETKDAAAYSDALFTAVKDGQLRLPDLATSLARVTTTAANAGIPFDMLMASVASLTAKGMPAEQAIDGLKEAFNNIIKPSETAAKYSKDLGVEFDVGALKAQGFDGMLQGLIKATGGNIDKMALFFGSATALNAVMALGSDASGKFAATLADMGSKTGATSAAYDKMADTFTLTNNRIINNLKATLIDLGTPLLAQYGSAGQAVAAVFQGLSIGIDAGAFQPVFDALKRFSDEATAYLEKVGKALPDALKQLNFSDLIRAFEDLGGSIGDAFDGIDLTTPKGLAEALQAAVDTMTSLVDTTRGIAEAFKPVINAVGEAVTRFNELSSGDKAAFGEKFLGNAILIQQAGTLVAGALIAIGGSAEGMKETFNSVEFWMGSVKLGAQFMALGVLSSLEAIQRGFAGLLPDWSDWKTEILTEADALHSGMQKIAAGIKATMDSIGTHDNSLKDALDTTARAATNAIPPVVDLKKEVADIIASARGAATSTKAAADAIDSAGVSYRNVAQDAAKLNLAAKDLDATQTGVAAVQDKVKSSSDGMSAAYRAAAATASTLIAEQVKQEGGTISLNKALAALEGATEGSTFSLGRMVDNTKKASKTLDEAANVSEAFRLKMLDVQADVAKTDLKLSFDLQIAKVEADSKSVVAAFDTIKESFGSTGALLGTMWDNLMLVSGTAGTSQLQTAIQKQIDSEEQRRMDLHNKQMAMYQMQIDTQKIKNQLLQQGGGLITINSSGLEPALEMVMWHILEKVQLQVNAAASEFLLGI